MISAKLLAAVTALFKPKKYYKHSCDLGNAKFYLYSDSPKTPLAFIYSDSAAWIHSKIEVTKEEYDNR